MIKSRVQILAIIVVMCAFAKAYAQESPSKLLSKNDAVTRMLANNFGIQLANNEIAIAQNNKGLLNSGYLPTLTGNGAANYTVNDQTATFQNGTEQAVDGAETTTYNASINLAYTLFDGLGRHYNFKELKERYNLSKLQARATIENTMLQLFTVYYEVARRVENITVLEQALAISRERELRATYQFEYGQVNRLQILNAAVNRTTDSINLLNEKQTLRNAQRDLNVVLATDLETLREVDTTVLFISPLLIDSYIESASQNNVRLLQNEQNIKITDYQIKGAKAFLLPTVGLTGSYGWNEGNFPSTGFLSSNVSTGFQAGAALRWNLFDGGQSIVALKNAKIALQSQELIKEQLKQEVLRDIANASGNYKNALAIYKLQEQNVLTNASNFERTQEQFKLGQGTSIEFREAQLNLLNAQIIKNQAKYTAKFAEIQLLQLTGQLLNVAF